MLRLCLIFPLLIAAGCSSFAFEPPVPSGKIIVIPFRYEEDRLNHFESSIGRDVAERVATLINRNAKKGTYKIVHLSALSKKLREELRNSKADEIDWAEVGRAAGADMVFSGNITKFEVKKPGDVNLFAGTVKVNVFVIGAADAARLYDRTHLVKHPEGTFVPPYDLGSDWVKMRKQLVLKTASTCAKPFYPSLEKKDDD